MPNKKKPVIALGFDQVIHSYTSGWQGPRTISDQPVPGALEALVKYSKLFDIHIYSSRSRYFLGKRAMRRWLVSYLSNYFLNFTYGYPDLPTPDTIQECYLKAFMLVKSIKFPIIRKDVFLIIDQNVISFNGDWNSRYYTLENVLSVQTGIYAHDKSA